MANIQLGGSVGTTGTAILGSVTITMPSDADYTLLVSEYTNQFLNVTSSTSLSVTRNIFVPIVEGVTYIVQNNTSGDESIQIIGSSGTGVTIANGATTSVVCDGTNYFVSGGVFPNVVTLAPGSPADYSSLFTTATGINDYFNSFPEPTNMAFPVATTVWCDFALNGDTFTLDTSIALPNMTLKGIVNVANVVYPTLVTAGNFLGGSFDSGFWEGLIGLEDITISVSGGLALNSEEFIKTQGQTQIISTDGNFFVDQIDNLTIGAYDSLTLGDGTHAIIRVNGFVLTINSYGTLTLKANAITLSGGTLVINLYSPTSIIDPSYFTTAGVTINYLFTEPLRPRYTGTFTTSDSSTHVFTALTATLPSSPTAANTEVSVLLTATDGTDAATFYLHGSYLNISGTITTLTYASTPSNSANTSGATAWTASLVLSGTTITVVIQGAGTTIQWTGENQLTIGYAP